MESREVKLQKARAFFTGGRNCAQSTAAPFAEECGIDEMQVLRAMSGFGGGVAGLKETCGVVSGIAMVVGMTEEKSLSTEPADKAHVKTQAQEQIKKFVDEYDTTNCGKLLEELEKNPIQSDDPAYEKSPCLKLVEAGVNIIYDYLSNK